MARIKLTKYQEKEYQAVKDTLILKNRREYLNLKKDIRKVNRYYNRAYVESNGLVEKVHMSSKLRTHPDRSAIIIHLKSALETTKDVTRMVGRGKNRHEEKFKIKVKQTYKGFLKKSIEDERKLIDDNFKTLFSDFVGGDRLIARLMKMTNTHLAQFLNMFSQIKREVYYYDQKISKYKTDALERMEVTDINVSTVNGYIDQFDKRMHYKY